MSETIALSGILTLCAPVVCRDGKLHGALYAQKWIFLPGESVGLEAPWQGRGTHPSAPWFAIATRRDSDNIEAQVPGTQVSGFVACEIATLTAGEWFDITPEES
jgi:hypothetical protein